MDPLMLTSVLSNLANVAGVAGSFFGGGGSQGLSREDQRWLADFQWKQSLRNEAFQKDLAYNGMQIRMQDAERAGVHPLAAMGVNPASGGNFQSAFPLGAEQKGPSRWPGALSEMGQNMSRSIMAMQTPEQKMLAQVQLDNEKLQGDYIRAQTMESLARAKNMAGTGPGLPSPYGGMSADVPQWPNKHILIKNPDGSYSLQYSPEMSTAMMARPLTAWIEDLEDMSRYRINEPLRSIRQNLNPDTSKSNWPYNSRPYGR